MWIWKAMGLLNKDITLRAYPGFYFSNPKYNTSYCLAINWDSFGI